MQFGIRRVQPLLGRLELLFMGRSIVRNIVGQSETSIEFPAAIEQKELIFIKLPIRSLTQDARLIGTMLTAQIHAGVFSFANRPANERPGVSLYIDEFQNFVTPDIAELFTEGRKFGVKLTVAHQYRSQLPDYLQASTMTARTKICFQLTPEDGHELAHLFSGGEGEVRPEDIDPHPTAHLLAYGSDNQHAKDLTEWYLRPLLSQKSGQHVEIAVPRNPLDVGIQTNVLGVLTSPNPLHWFSPKEPAPNPVVADPTTYLDALLYNVMTTGNPTLPIPAPIAYGFSNCGTGFYRQLQLSLNKGWLLSSAVTYPEALVVEEPDGSQRWTRRPENGNEQLYHFIFLLRMTMKHLAQEPIGKRSELSHADIASMLTKLPRRAAFVRSGDDVGVMYTNNLPKPLTGDAFAERLQAIYHQTHERYCRPKEEVERALFGNPRNQETLTTPTEEPDTPLRRWEEL